MQNYKKSVIFGFTTGVVFVFAATLGLVIGLIEFLKPALSPGTELIRGMAENLPAPLLLGLVLNGSIYALLFVVLGYIKNTVNNKAYRLFAITGTIILFLAVTGMISDIYQLITSPGGSRIFNVGA